MAENRVKIVIELPADQAVQGVAQIVDALDGLGATATTSGQKVDAALTTTTEKTKELSRAGKAAADTLESAWSKLGLRSGNAIRADIAETIAAYKKLASSGGASGQDLEAALAAAKTRVADLRRELSRVKEVDGLKAQVQQARQFGAELGQLESLARTAGAAIASYLTVHGLVELAQDIMAVGMQFDALRNSLKTASGDSATAAQDFAFVSSEAKRLGLELLSTGQAYAQLKNAAKGTALEGQATEKIFSGVAEASRALHLTSEQTSGALLALQQMMSKGTVQAEELRGQLGERLPGAFNLAAQAMGVTTAELGKMLEQGQVLAVDLLPKLAEALHQAYGAGAAEAAQSAAAEMERLKNTVAEYKDMVYSAFSDDLAGAIRSTTNLLNENQESVNLYLLGIKGYAQGAAAEIRKVGEETGLTTEKVIKFYETMLRFVPLLNNFVKAKDALSAIGSALREKGQETEQHQGLSSLLSEIEGIAKNGQRPMLKSYSQDEYNKMMGLTPSYDSTKLMSGVPLSALSKLQKQWSDILPKIAQVNKEISGGNLQGSGLEKALQDRAKLYDGLAIAQQDYQKSLDKGSKAEERAAIAAERYGEQASAYLDNVTQSLQSMQDSLSGGLNKEADRVDKWFVQAINQAEKAMVGAKGDTSAYVQVLEMLRDAWPRLKDLAVQKDIISALKQQSQLLQDIAQATGDPGMAYEGQEKAAKAWFAEKKQLIESSYQDEAQRADMLAKLQQGYDAKLLTARADAYKDLAGVSGQYWEAEKQRIEQHLAIVKQYATDETAYKMYEAQQWDAYNKALLEKQEQYAGTFAETLAAKWALAFGTYKSEATKAKESWEQTAQAAIDAANSVVDGIAGGVGDMVRSFGDGTASIESLFQNLRSRILDMFASMIEEMVRRWLKDFIGRLGSGDFSLGSLFGSSSTSSGGSGISLSGLTGSGGGSGGITGSVSSIKTLGDYIGKATGDSFGSYLSTAAADGTAMFVGGEKALAGIVSDGFNMSDLVQQSTKFNSVPVEAMASTYNAAETAAMSATSLSSMLTTTLGVVGAIGGVVGLVSGLFGSSEKTEKTGSGYKIAINAGTLNMSGVDFYKTTTTSGMGGTSTSNFTVDTGMTDPDVAKAVNDALKETAENLHDFAKTLGITTGDLLSMLSMPEMTITEGQLDSYIRNSSNVMAFQALDSAGLRGAFDAVAEKYEAYVDEFKRLADAYKLVGGYTEAYGYDLKTLAGVTADDIAAIREVNTETALGTSQAIMSMATAMGATSDQLAELAANANDGSQALAVTDEQLSKILEADYASKLIDAVGGEDAFQTLMTNLVKNTLNSVQAYEENATYYAGKASDAIAELGRSGVTIDNFWQQFDAAMKGALSVDEFEKWADAAGWVNALNVVSDALDDWADTVAQSYENLNVRALKAQGLDYQAELTEMLAAAEQELTQAREAGYDAAYLQRLAEVQALEYAAKIAEHAEDYAKELLSARKRYATAIGDNTALIAIAMEENAQELQDLTKKFDWSPGSAEEGLFQAVQAAQTAEILAMAQEIGEALQAATESMERDLAARRATIAGYDEEAQALQMVAGFQDELNQAYEDGLDADLIGELMQVQLDELAKYWSDTIDQMQSDLADLYQKQSDLLGTLSGNTQSAMEELAALFTRYKAGEDDLGDTILDHISSIANAIDDMVNDIYNTIYEIRTGEDYTTDTADQVASNSLAYYNEQLALAASGDTEAMGSIRQYATGYLSAVKSSTADESVYNAARDYVTSTLSSLASGSTGTSSALTDIAKTVTNDQIAEAQEALRRAEVASLESQYETLMAQAVGAFKASQYGNLIQQMANTGTGWRLGIEFLNNDDNWDGAHTGVRAADRLISHSNETSTFLQYFFSRYGSGSGYVDWDSALSYWVQQTTAFGWPAASALPNDVAGIYAQAQTAYNNWQALKSQYGYTLGGVITGGSTSGDNTLVWANSGERVLTPTQNDAFEELVFGGRSDGLAAALIARVERLTDEVVELRRDSNSWDRIITRRLTSLDTRQEGWTEDAPLPVAVQGTVTVEGAA